MKPITTIIVLLLCALSATPAQTTDEQNLFRLAQSFEQAGDAEHAGQLYEQLEAMHPENIVYFEALRNNYTQRKNYDAAIALCLHRLYAQPLDVSVMTTLGGIYSMAGHQVQADSMWASVIASAPGNPGVYRMVAAEEMELRQLEKAAATYMRGRAATHDPYMFTNELAALHTVMMNYRGASDEYLLMLEQNEFQLDYVESRMSGYTNRPEGLSAAIASAQRYADDRTRSIVFLRLLTWLRMEAKQYGQALTCAEQIENRINSNGAELFTFAERAFRENAFAPAEKAYELSLQNGAAMPWAPQAKFGRARCLEELSLKADSAGSGEETGSTRASGIGDVLEAYTALAAEYPLTEIHAQALYRIGTLRASQLNDLNGALRAFDSITVIAPGSPMLSRVRMAMGDVFVRQGRLDDAWAQYAEVGSSPQSTPPQQSEARFRKAELLYFKADFDSALVMLEPLASNYQSDEANDALALRAFIIESKDDNPDALRAYAQADFLARRRKLSEAVAAFTAVILSYGSAPLADDALIKKAELEAALHRPVDAIRTLQTLLAEMPKSTERDKAQFRIGELYERGLHDKDTAMKAYGEVLAKYPNSLYTEEARKRMRLLRGDAL